MKQTNELTKSQNREKNTIKFEALKYNDEHRNGNECWLIAFISKCLGKKGLMFHSSWYDLAVKFLEESWDGSIGNSTHVMIDKCHRSSESMVSYQWSLVC
jgi:hypothetical protein